MGLFDVLRYQGTNISRRAELEILPEAIITEYWIRAHKVHPEYSQPDHPTKCRQLANWGQSENNLQNNYAREIFEQVLKEFNP